MTVDLGYMLYILYAIDNRGDEYFYNLTDATEDENISEIYYCIGDIVTHLEHIWEHIEERAITTQYVTSKSTWKI